MLCRWPSGSRIPVGLPPEASVPERAALESAIAGWNALDLGIELIPSGRATTQQGIRFRFVPPEPDARPTTGLTGTDCALSDPPRLVSAEIELQRHNLDMIGRPVPVDLDGLAGAAAHELGHALGFQGHVREGGSVLVREVGRVRRIGAEVRAGNAVPAPSVEALYRVPTGVSVGRVPLSAGSARLLGRLAGQAQAVGWAGPFVRVGDRSARIFWTAADGEGVALVVVDWANVLGGTEAVLVPNRQARDVLDASQ